MLTLSKRIVVVDDDPSILELLKIILEDEGYRVSAFHSPSAALNDTMADPPDAIVVDLMMPGMTGLQVVEAVRKDPRTRDVPALVCSAYYGDLHRAVRKAGEDGVTYLRKPFHVEELVGLVRDMLSEKRSPRAGGGRRIRQQKPQSEIALDSIYQGGRTAGI